MLLLEFVVLLLSFYHFPISSFALDSPTFPSLLDATLEEIAALLQTGSINSYDLVQVGLLLVIQLRNCLPA